MKLNERSNINSIGKNTWNPSTRSCSAIAATENPVSVFSFEQGRVVKEILLMSGAEYPEQVPLLDTHGRFETASILGSAGGFIVQGDALNCRITISEAAEDAAVKIQEGHLTDLSVGYEILDAIWIGEGKTIFEGRKSFTGPLQLVRRWRLKELSLCPIGADKEAKIRSYQSQNSEVNKMENTKTEDEIRAEERERVREITAMGERFGCPELARTLVNSGADMNQAREKVLDFQTKTRETMPMPSFRIEAGPMESEKRSAAMVDGLIVRGGGSIKNPAAGHLDFADYTLLDIARESLIMQGVRVNGLSGSRLIEKALSMRSHTTSDFPLILAGVSEKTLREAYMESPGTFAIWTKPETALNFKEISRTQLSEAGDLSTIPEGTEYQYGTFGESAEVYRILTLGKLFSITRQAIINDDLGALMRVPRAFAMAAKRTLNKLVYALLSDNAVMSDGVALFNEAHSNVADGSLSIATLGNARAEMRRQTGLAGEILNIAPRFLLVSAALETEADQILNTRSGFEATQGAGALNPFYKKLELIVEPLVDDFIGAPFYLAADPRQCDTVEVAYLNGQQTPYLETRDGWSIDGAAFKIRLDAGTKAIDHRGLFRVESDELS